MTASRQQGSPDGSQRKPVVLSKDEALYPPSGKALKIAAAIAVVAIILAVASFILFPVG